MSKARKNEMNKDIPEERITLRVLKNYSKMQEELCVYVRKHVNKATDLMNSTISYRGLARKKLDVSWRSTESYS